MWVYVSTFADYFSDSTEIPISWEMYFKNKKRDLQLFVTLSKNLSLTIAKWNVIRDQNFYFVREEGVAPQRH